jgi:hypothetical protein
MVGLYITSVQFHSLGSLLFIQKYVADIHLLCIKNPLRLDAVLQITKCKRKEHRFQFLLPFAGSCSNGSH